MPSPEYENFARHLKPAFDPTDPALVAREKMIAIHPVGCAETTSVEPLELAGIACEWVRVPEASSERSVFFVHGGAFISTGLIHYQQYGQSVSHFVDARVLNFEYRLAPETPFPGALDDTLAVYRAALEKGLDPARTAFMGDSCGGGIALAAMCALRDANDPLPACYVGLTPWFDALQRGDAAVHPRGLDPFVDAAWVRARFRDYAGDHALDDPLLSPLEADLSGLPPMFLGVGQIDTTSDDSTRLAARAARAGVQLQLDVTAGVIHGIHGLAGMLPEATAAMERVGDFVRRYIP